METPALFINETDMATLLTNVYGDFYYLFAVPGDATPGAHTVSAPARSP